MYALDEDHEQGPGAAFEQEVRVNILRYLDASGHLQSLERAGNRYKESLLLLARTEAGDGSRGGGPGHGPGASPPSFTCTLQLDLSQIAEISSDTCSLILEQPLLAQHLFRDVVHCSLVALCCLPTLTPDQVQVVLRVSSLPGEDGLRTDGTKRPGAKERRLLLLQQVAVAVTSPTKYTRSAVFRCPNLSCPGGAGLRVWGPTASRRRCRFCGGVAEETPRGRDVGEEVLALMVRPDALRAKDEASVGHPTLVRFSGDLARADILQLGCRYDVVVLMGPLAEAWGVRPWQDGALRRVARGLRSDPLPPSVQGIWVEASADSESPWAFAVSLASQLSMGRYPAHTFLHMKLGILLSLASQGLDHPPVPLLAIGGDPAGQVLLYRCLRLADRGLTVTSAQGFAKLSAAPALAGYARAGGGTSAKASTGAWLSASPLVLAQGGVCLLGCWDKWNRTSAAVSVISALESGKAALESRDLAGMALPEAGPSVPLQCAAWSYWTPNSCGKPADLLTLRTLLNTLGAPVLADSGSDDEMEAICDHLLLKARREEVLPCGVLEGEIREFLTLVNAQPVTLTDEATRLIQEYFVASRRVRPNCLPVTAVGTIAAMAEALARISMRMEATWADVVLVVWMYEVAFTALFGPCLISPLPEDCGLPFYAEHLTDQVDSRLNSMKVWLENFTKSVLLSSLRVERDNNWS